MVRSTRMRRRLLVGVVAGALLFGGSLLQSTEALASISPSPGTRAQSAALAKRAATGEHLPEATLIVRSERPKP